MSWRKEEHSETYPKLLTTVWNALKLAGRCKQSVDMAACEALVGTAATIATAFWATKGVEYSNPSTAARYGT